jgi:hypothetical protein
MQIHSQLGQSKSNGAITFNKPKLFFSPLTVQAKSDPDPAKVSAAPEIHWTGSIKGHLGKHPTAYHTLNNFGDTSIKYKLRIKNSGRALLSLETQYEYKAEGLQRAWTAGSAQHGETFEVVNGLPPHSSLHLRLFGEHDYTEPTQTWCEGTAETELQK